MIDDYRKLRLCVIFFWSKLLDFGNPTYSNIYPFFKIKIKVVFAKSYRHTAKNKLSINCIEIVNLLATHFILKLNEFNSNKYIFLKEKNDLKKLYIIKWEDVEIEYASLTFYN